MIHIKNLYNINKNINYILNYKNYVYTLRNNTLKIL